MRRFAVIIGLLLVLGTTLTYAGVPGQPPRAQVIVLSNSSPNVSVIDAETNQIVKTADIPRMTAWAWNDDNNYYDGTHLWLGLHDPETDAVEALLLDLDSLRVTRRIPLGKDRVTVYIGKPSRYGAVLVSKHASGEIAVIDRTTFAVRTLKVPVNGGVACDIDIATPTDGIERAYVPTDTGNTVLAIETSTLKVLRTLPFPGTRPFMLTVASDGTQVWVEERTGNSVAVLDGATLSLVKQLPAGKTPIVGTFSPDGKVHFIGHVADSAVIAFDTRTYKELWRSQVGTFPEKLGVHPASTFVYAILTKEGAVAVLDAHTGKVVKAIPLGTNPTGIFVRRIG